MLRTKLNETHADSTVLRYVSNAKLTRTCELLIVVSVIPVWRCTLDGNIRAFVVFMLILRQSSLPLRGVSLLCL